MKTKVINVPVFASKESTEVIYTIDVDLSKINIFSGGLCSGKTTNVRAILNQLEKDRVIFGAGVPSDNLPQAYHVWGDHKDVARRIKKCPAGWAMLIEEVPFDVLSRNLQNLKKAISVGTKVIIATSNSMDYPINPALYDFDDVVMWLCTYMEQPVPQKQVAPKINEKPILFSTPMVQAILAGNKTQTRRICKRQPHNWQVYTKYEDGTFNINGPDYDSEDIQCPYGQVGNRLWLREEHYRFGWWEKDGLTKTGKVKWRFKAHIPDVCYFNNPPTMFRKSIDKGRPDMLQWYKRLARFMPRAACRLVLEITNIRVERLLDIKYQDTIAEGVQTWCDNLKHKEFYDPNSCLKYYPDIAFIRLWVSINGPDSWAANPWVWVVEFRKVEGGVKGE